MVIKAVSILQLPRRYLASGRILDNVNQLEKILPVAQDFKLKQEIAPMAHWKNVQNRTQKGRLIVLLLEQHCQSAKVSFDWICQTRVH